LRQHGCRSSSLGPVTLLLLLLLLPWVLLLLFPSL